MLKVLVDGVIGGDPPDTFFVLTQLASFPAGAVGAGEGSKTQPVLFHAVGPPGRLLTLAVTASEIVALGATVTDDWLSRVTETEVILSVKVTVKLAPVDRLVAVRVNVTPRSPTSTT
jgi:hypothetical protein